MTTIRNQRAYAARLSLFCLSWMALVGCSGPNKVQTDTQTQTIAMSLKTEEHKNHNDTANTTQAEIHIAANNPPEPKRPETPSGENSYRDRSDARTLASQIAREQNLSEDWVLSVIGKARYQSQATRLMMPQPKGVPKNWSAYRAKLVDPSRIRYGHAFWRDHQHALERAEKTYGVPVEVVLGIIGVETMYGRNTGNFRVLDVLTTLALDFPAGRGDRSAFFKAELGAFLKLCAVRSWDPESVAGSYAGAIGWPQFMPSSIHRWGVDFDGDGKVDVQRSPVDAIGSVAHYLAQHGWKRGQATHFKVTPPRNQMAMDTLLGPDIKPSFGASQMISMGADLPAEALSHEGLLALVLLENGNSPPTLIAGTENFYAITRYNKSSYYAMAVIELGEAIRKSETCLTKKRDRCWQIN